MGTVNLLEAIRRYNAQHAEKVQSFLNVTTDKVYENPDLADHAFREDEKLDGYDPYSNSKSCSELVTHSYQKSFFSPGADPSATVTAISTARAGNVIGGGDWAVDRIVPDAMRAFFVGRPLVVRNSASIRPWQHVLEPLCGYLTLGEKLYLDSRFAQAFNFGPRQDTVKTVAQLVRELVATSGGFEVIDRTDPTAPHEAKLLMLDSRKATRLLGWKPRWNFRRTLWETSEWYKGKHGFESATKLCQQQIRSYCQEEAK